jgi:hypothetical protein
MQAREKVDPARFNHELTLPYSLRQSDFQIAMEDAYDFFFDVNNFFLDRGLPRLDDLLRPANMSGLLSDMLTASIAKHSRTLVQNCYHNGHPDLLLGGKYPLNRAKAGEEGIEVKTTRKKGGAVDTHGGRNQWMCVFVYEVDAESEPAQSRRPMRFTELYLSQVTVQDFRKNARGELGTRTATLDRDGIKKLRADWVYKLDPA